MTTNDTLGTASAAVQTHITLLQSVIQRMATNSSACKTWNLTLVAAILVVIADKGKPEFAWIAVLPTVMFMGLDAYYLALEKAFRTSYELFIDKLHDGTLVANDLFVVKPQGKGSAHQLKAITSFSIWGFYLPLIILILLAKYLVLA